MRFTAAVLLLLASFAAQGQVSVTCTAPTKNSDGSNITGTITYRFFEGTSATSQPNASPVQSACSYTWTNLSVGTHYFSATAIVGGVESATKSNVASRAVAALPPPVPLPPTGLTATVTDPVAYEIRTSGGNLVATRIGMVGVGTFCSPETLTVANVKYNRVQLTDTDLINFPTGTLATLKVYARCG